MGIHRKGKGSPRKSDMNPRKKQKHQRCYYTGANHKKKKMERKLKELHKLHPENKYQIKVTGKNKYGKDITCITLVKGKKYKKTKSPGNSGETGAVSH